MEPPHDYPPEYDTLEIQRDRILHLEQVEESMNKLAGELTDELNAAKQDSKNLRAKIKAILCECPADSTCFTGGCRLSRIRAIAEGGDND